ncbi:rRNA-processing protein fcf2-like isoform X2 [Cicer arietinum]|uniref:rRNA-processing protein fcf2-like n=1 Tax=Cicer arietinum TaxID=3827 RepID=A0A1S2XL28_CICAR|nr:rRNA-processing protein fcf2-like [Cicer arietinum]
MAEKKPVIGLSWQPQFTIPSRSKTTDDASHAKSQTKAPSSTLWKPNSELINGLFVPPNDPRKLNKLMREQAKDTAGKSWFDMPAQTITPELQRELKLLNLRDVLDPKRHYKRCESKSKALPKYFQVGTVEETSVDYFSGRLNKKERKATLAEEFLSDQNLAAYRKRKVREIEEHRRPGGNEKWKIQGQSSRKRAKEKRKY